MTRFCVHDGQETTEERYFISSLPIGVKRFARAVRAHWGIENSCHWSLDVTYREDDSRFHAKHLREHFAWLRWFTLSLLKQHPAKLSLSMKRPSCGWSNDFIMQVLVTSTT
ncbi:ISAs1 family transposase [Thalassoroseus pseudoceratinae]|uniref:ISAs1 family transposase n=1 Tax=Thalassoroseus pseudoceratinae TaxID=2713176 RepID=UPI001423AAD7